MTGSNNASEIAMLAKLVAQRRSDGKSFNAACRQVADELDPVRWTGGYLKTLLGKSPPKPGDELCAAIRRLYRKKQHRKAPKRYWLKIEAETEEEKAVWMDMIPMDRRQDLLRAEIERLLWEEERDRKR